jgi:hypothetical protein
MCGEMDRDVWYAPSSGFDTFKCEHCGTVNEIVMGFVSKVNISEIDNGKIEMEGD